MSLARGMGKEEEDAYKDKALFEHSNPSAPGGQSVTASEVNIFFFFELSSRS